ncbi:MAG TPA: FUSC family protein, partial [Solirubrobacteraceae bacterium]|nr:FUSC family protein [Solirubrobacteraceae bacterium]
MSVKQRLPAASPSSRWWHRLSKPAAIRAVRAALVIPVVFVIADKVIANAQVALFAGFGGFATLVFATFGGGWREQLKAHVALAVAGSVLITIGTIVSSSTALAALVTIPVTFVVFFSGVAGSNAAAGVRGALLAYVLPAATAGTPAQLPDRLAGWWLASVAGTTAVLVLQTPRPPDRLRTAARKLVDRLADELDRAVAGSDVDAQAVVAAKLELMQQFDAEPDRPNGLALADQAFSNVVELLEWCALLILDLTRERVDVRGAPSSERELVETSAIVLRQCGALLGGGRRQPALDRLHACRRRADESIDARAASGGDEYLARVHLSFHTQAIATAVMSIGVDAMLSVGIVGPAWLAGTGMNLLTERPFPAPAHRHDARLSRYAGVLSRHMNVRSIWFINSLRGSLALAAAVAVAGLTRAPHGFWVVLGTLSVMRASVASTGETALRALLGTAIGVAIGAGLMIAIGSSTAALWVALPIAILVAAYLPGVAPFPVGQAAFTVMVIVLFNILVPVGWKVGEVRIEDVALGCTVSILVGLAVWPRGIASVVGDDLADAFRTGAAYLKEASDWVCGLSAEPGGAFPSANAGLRLDEALRGLLAEQGAKHIKKRELWRLVGGTL